MNKYLNLFTKGFCMGAADVVPGVSGGTMAFILGIYEELLQAIRSFDLAFLRLLASLKFREAFEHTGWRFLLALGSGILFAIFTLARLISWLLVNHPVFIWSFFFGLVLASVLTVFRHINKWTPGLLVFALLGAVGAYVLVGLMPAVTPNAPWFLFLSGALAICAMILPGISGSFILVLLGKYQYVLDAVNNRDFLTLFLVAAGCVFGITLFARFLGWLFSRHHDLTIALLCGLMLGSLRKVWPWKRIDYLADIQGQVLNTMESNIMPQGFDSEVALALALALAGICLVLLLEHTAKTKSSQ
jgi:putative membrane protein